MRIQKLSFLGILILSLIIASAGLADVPKSIDVQGVLTTDLGNPVSNGSYSIMFRVYDAASGGIELWSSDGFVMVDVEGGLFNYQLGSDIPLPDSLVNYDALWLGLTISGEAEMTPRIPLVSVAFALHACYADSVGYTGSSGGWVDDGSTVRLENQGDSVGIGTDNPTEKLDVEGDVNISGQLSLGGPKYANRRLLVETEGTMDTIGINVTNLSGTAASFNSGVASGYGYPTEPAAVSAYSNGVCYAGRFNAGGDGIGVFARSGGVGNAIHSMAAGTGYSGFFEGGQGVKIDGNLEASGTLTFPTGAAAGRVLTSDASGVASWQVPPAGSPWTKNGSYVYPSSLSDNVGIGTATPAQELEVVGNAQVSGLLNVGSGHTNTWESSSITGGTNNVIDNAETVISGGMDNTATGYASTVGGGIQNDATASYSGVSGGFSNLAGAQLATVSGGSLNLATASGATIGGGLRNRARGDYSVVGGGGGPSDADSNSAIGNYSTISGGRKNRAVTSGGTVGGGINNSAGDFFSTVGGGQNNNASDIWATVAGGVENHATEDGGFIGGGGYNEARGMYSVIAGGGGLTAADSNSASAEASAIGGGRGNVAAATGSTVGGGFFNRARGLYSVVAGGGGSTAADSNAAHGDFSTVSGGVGNVAEAAWSTVGGGRSNTINGGYATISGGGFSVADGEGSTVAGGQWNNATGRNATVGGGYYNHARGEYSVICGGGGNFPADSNYAYGTRSTVAGGSRNGAVGHYSFTAGYRGKANHEGTFVWADRTSADFVSTGDNQFLVRATGGMGIGVTAPNGQLDVTDNADGVALHISNADRDITWPAGQSLQLGDWNGTTFSQRMRINGDGNVGINTTAPIGQLHVKSNADGIALHVSNAIGDITWPDDNTLNLGTWNGTTFNEHMRITAGGNVGIGASSTPNILTVVQYSATDPIADAWTTYSSRRWKENIQPLENALAKVQQLRGVSYDWKKDGRADIGLIAEEVAEVIPEVVAFEDNGIDARSVDYARLVALLIESIKEQQQTILQQETDMDKLKAEMAEMKAMLQQFIDERQ